MSTTKGMTAVMPADEGTVAEVTINRDDSVEDAATLRTLRPRRTTTKRSTTTAAGMPHGCA